MSEFTVTRYFPIQHDRRSPEFYVDGSGHTLVASVSKGDNEIHIYCDGEMRYELFHNPDTAPYATVRTAADWEGTKITNDFMLQNLSGTPDCELVNNPWFDLYDQDGEHLDFVGADIDEMILQAGILLKEISN